MQERSVNLRWGRWLLGLMIPLVLALPASAVPEEETSGDNPGFLAASGRITYRRYCATCHGMKADGTGSVAKFLKVPPSDLRRIRERASGEWPYELLEKIIDGRWEVRGHGTREMPVWGEVFQNPLSQTSSMRDETGEERAKRMIKELIYFIETLQKEPEEAPQEETRESSAGP